MRSVWRLCHEPCHVGHRCCLLLVCTCIMNDRSPSGARVLCNCWQAVPQLSHGQAHSNTFKQLGGDCSWEHGSFGKRIFCIPPRRFPFQEELLTSRPPHTSLDLLLCCSTKSHDQLLLGITLSVCCAMRPTAAASITMGEQQQQHLEWGRPWLLFCAGSCSPAQQRQAAAPAPAH